MYNLSSASVIAAINGYVFERDIASHNDTPSGGFENSFGMILYGNVVSWKGFGGVKVCYDAAKIQLIRHLAYYSMPATRYLTDLQLLYHYFIYLTPINLLADAAIQAVKSENNHVNVVTLN